MPLKQRGTRPELRLLRIVGQQIKVGSEAAQMIYITVH